MSSLWCYMHFPSSCQLADPGLALLAGAMSAGRSATLQRTAEQGAVVGVVKVEGMTAEAEGVGMTEEEDMIVIGALTAAVAADMTGHAGIWSQHHVCKGLAPTVPTWSFH